MDKLEVIRRLRAREADLRAMGIERLSIFGSVARGEQTTASDVDLAAHLRDDLRLGIFGFLAIEASLADLLGTKVDLISEPARKSRLQAQIDQDRQHVF